MLAHLAVQALALPNPPHSPSLPLSQMRALVNIRGYSRWGGGDWVEKTVRAAPNDHRTKLKSLLELAVRTGRDWETGVSSFLTPSMRGLVENAIGQAEEVGCVAFGGYPGAERAKLIVGRPEILETIHEAEPKLSSITDDTLALSEIVPVHIRGKFKFQPPSHREFLGSILGCGIRREMVGDIIVLPDHSGALAFVSSSIVAYLQSHLSKVRRTTVNVEILDASALTEFLDKVQGETESRVRKIKRVEKSLRLDAVTSAAFGLSRAKASTMIKKGMVMINWTERPGSSEVKGGDVISARGLGRAMVHAVEVTSKGNFLIEIHIPQ